MKKLSVAVLAVVFSLAGQSLYAAGAPSAAPASHGNMQMTKPDASDNASTKAFKQANTKMHQDMDIAFTGDADVDYMRGMIAHHQGAIDMSKVVLAHGKDSEVRKLANNVIKEQDAEIKQIKAWLIKRGH